VFCGNARKDGITKETGLGTTERRVGHHRHAVLPAPRQHVIFNLPVRQAVADLIGRATIAAWNTEEIFHLGDCEVGYAPSADLAHRGQATTSEYAAPAAGQCSK